MGRGGRDARAAVSGLDIEALWAQRVTYARVNAAGTIKYRGSRADDTVIRLEDWLPDRTDGQAVLHITTGSQRLTKEEGFVGTRVERANAKITEGRGRVISCIHDETNQILGAISFSLGSGGASEPLLLWGIHIPRGASVPDDVKLLGPRVARLLKRYVHAIALKLQRPGELLYVADTGAAENYARRELHMRRDHEDRGDVYMVEPLPKDLV